MPPVKSIDLSASALSVPVGGVVELRATPIQANGKPSGASVAFTPVEGTATVVKTGNHTATVTLGAAGASVVRATCGSARASLTVSAPPPPPVEPPPVEPPPVEPPPWSPRRLWWCHRPSWCRLRWSRHPRRQWRATPSCPASCPT